MPRLLPLGVSREFAGMVVCVTCHTVHADDADQALLRGLPADPAGEVFAGWRELCRDCHGEALAKRSPHAGDERACGFCHGVKPEKGGKVPLTWAGTRLCNFCHGGLQNRHFEKQNPFGGEVTCWRCHEPHARKEPPGRLKKSYVESIRGLHTSSPHYLRSFCFACHPRTGEAALLSTDETALCNRCHGTGEIVGAPHPMRTVPAARKFPSGWPLLDGTMTCRTCHRPGHQEDRGRFRFLRGGPYANRSEICPTCHAGSRLTEENPHERAGDLEGCETCHTARPDPSKVQEARASLRASSILLCLRCHAVEPHPAGFDHLVTVGPERAAGMSRELPLGAFRRITCSTCHSPHIKQADAHRFRQGGAGIEICVSCHAY